MAVRHLAEQLNLFALPDSSDSSDSIVRFCKTCGKNRPEEEFRKGERIFKLCHACREYESFHRLTFLYGITREQYDELLTAQNGRCALCGRRYGEMRGQRVRLDVDHDHVTGKVRGLLCNRCNTRLGGLSDRLDVVEDKATESERHAHKWKRKAIYWKRAAAYLRRSTER